MKNLNLFRKSARGSEGSTLASAVVRPSFDRRSTVVKHLAFMLLFLLGSLNVWGAEELVYTLNYYKTGSGTASGYDATATFSDSDMSWTIPGNQTTNPPRIGGKGGTKTSDQKTVDRVISSTTALSDDVSKIDIEYGTISASNITINSITITVSQNSDFSDPVSELSSEFSASDVVTVSRPNNVSWANCYYKINYNITLKGKNNVFFQFVQAKFYAETGGTPKCSTPTFSPVAGAVVSGTNVSISSTTEGATIYYTTDGSTPTTSSATSQPIEITAATTIKAIAVKGGYDNSEVATASYTIVTPLATMQDIYDAATASEEDVYITFNNWIVTGVKSSNAYVTDGTKGFIIYQSSHGFAAGNVLSGTVACKLVKYKGAAELKGVTAAMLTIDPTPGVAPVNELDAAGIDALTGVNTGSVIKISGECTKPETKYFVAGVQLYNQLFSFGDLSVGDNYNCTGVYVLNTDFGNEILPRSVADVELITSIATPTISPDPSVTYTEAQNISITCSTDGATIYYTTDGTDPKTSGTKSAYSAPFQLSANATVKAIANKDEDWSDLATAAYTINIPLPSHDFQYTHKFETSEGFEFPDGWGTSYAEHEIAYTDDKVVFAGASKQNAGATIDDCPVTKNQAISLVLTNTSKIITAVRFDYKQWGTKAQTLTMKYSTDGGANYNAFDPAVSSTNFALQVLDLPAGTNAIQVTGSNSSSQVGLTSIAFDLANKPVVTKTVTITTPSNGTLVVKNAGVAITSGDAIEVGTTLTIEATPDTDYSLSSISVKDESDNDVPVNGDNEFDVPNSNVTVSATFVEDVRPEATLTLWENGTEVAYPGSHKQNDHVILPNSVTHNCYGRVFVGWSADEVAQTDVKPAYLEPGADFTLSAAGENTLYAVYAAVATPAGYQKLESDAFETTATYVIGAEQSSTDATMWYFSSYSGTDSNINWGVMTNAPETTAPVEFTLSGTASELVAQDASGNYLAGLNTGKFKMSSTSTTVALSAEGVIGTTNSYVLRHNYNGGNGGLRWYSGTTGTQAYFYKVVSATYNKYSTTCDAAIDAPEFDLAEDTYTSAQTVTITAAPGATIYYTLDGNDPTTSSDVYSSPIELNEAGEYTLKAFAVKGEAESDITSATYTINLPLTTMDQIFAKANAVGTTATDVTIIFDSWVVSSISTNGKQVYLTDGSKGLVIFDNGGSLGFSVGDILNGTVDCKLQKYNGFSEVTTLTASSTGLTVTEGGTITPQIVSIEGLSGVNTGAPIIVENVKFDGTDLVDASDNKIQPYTTLFADAVTSLTENKYYDVTGIYTQFNTKKEILPRDADDIDELTQEAPTMTWYTSDAKTATIAANATYTIDLGDAFAPVFETNSAGTRTYSSSDPTIAEINETTGTLTLKGVTGTTFIKCEVAAAGDYTAGEQGFTLRVLQGATVDYVVILAQYNGSWYAMKNTGVTSSKAAAIEVAYSEGKVWNLSTSDQEAITWKRTVNGGNVTFQAPNNNYLQTSSNNLAMGAEECIWTWNETYYRTGSQTRTFLYRPSACGFKSNAVSNAGSNDYSALPVITTAVFADGEGYTEVRSGLEVNRHYTVCLPKNITHIKGATFWNLQYKNAGNTEVYLVEETAPEAGKPYIIQATDTKLEVVYGEEIAADPVANGALRGTFTGINATDFAALEGTVYLLINNAIRPRTAGNYLDANRAYVRYDELNVGTPASIPGRRVKAMPMAPQVATGVDKVPSDQVPNTKVLINGQLFILRGEKMYDAKGQLVK